MPTSQRLQIEMPRLFAVEDGFDEEVAPQN